MCWKAQAVINQTYSDTNLILSKVHWIMTVPLPGGVESSWWTIAVAWKGHLLLLFFVFIFSVFMPSDCVRDGTYRGTDEFGRIVAVNSFNREITEDEAAVLFFNVLVVLFESVTGVAGGVDRCEKINSTDDVFVARIAFCILYWINTLQTNNPCKYSYDISKVSWRRWSLRCLWVFLWIHHWNGRIEQGFTPLQW